MVLLNKDESLLEIPAGLISCLTIEPYAYERFLQFTEGDQKAFIDWIYSAKTDETKVKRIAITINKALKQQKLSDKKRQND